MKHVFALVVLLALAACSDQPPPPVAKAPEAPKPEPKAEEPKPDPNKELAQKVKRALEQDARIQAGGIDVTAKEGTVTLWGTAATQSERNRASAAAAKVDGVKTVDNRLAVVKGS